MHQSVRGRVAALAIVAVAALAAACNDPLRPDASLVSEELSFFAYAVNGTDARLATALDLYTPGLGSDVYPLGANTPIDIVFDVNAAGKAVLYPANLVRLDVGTRTGLQIVATTYDSLFVAPTSKYVVDTALVVNPSQTVAIDAPRDARRCPYYAPRIYAKLVVDSVDVPSRRVFFRYTVDPNCGYRELKPGVRPER